MYRFQGETLLVFVMLYTQDGNNSLKHICRWVVDDEGAPGASFEHLDTRTIGSEFYLSLEEVDKWAVDATQVK